MVIKAINAAAAGEDFVPLKILEIELSQPLPDLLEQDYWNLTPLQKVLVFVRLHAAPLGVIEWTPAESDLDPEKFAAFIWRELGSAVNAHLRQDGLDERATLPASGLTGGEQPRCLVERARVLAGAPKASVLVATHNRPAVLANCLHSLQAMDYPDFEIIVVDNAPADDATQAMIARDFASDYARSSSIRYVREPQPGLARAHNRGLEEVHTAIVAITDDDVLVDPNWLLELVKGFASAEKVGCVTGTIFPAEIQTQSQYWVERSVGFTKGFARREYSMRSAADHPLFPYAAGMFGSGANMAFDVAILNQTGGFDDSLGAGSIAQGGDDLAAFFQIVAQGFTLVYEPAAIVYHRHYREYARLQKTAYGYGAGLTAYLTKTLLDRPLRIFDLARRVPYGLFYALSARSPKNARKTQDYPRELSWIERKGMVAGPFLYLRSRWHTHKLRRRPAAQHRFERGLK